MFSFYYRGIKDIIVRRMKLGTLDYLFGIELFGICETYVKLYLTFT